jgi:dTMP kinase
MDESPTLATVTSDAESARGRLITLEGPEGAGKSTQAARIRLLLEQLGMEVVLAREPGGTPTGEAIREVLLTTAEGTSPIRPRVDALLFNAARAQLLEEVVRPALRRGAWVVLDRYADSTIAYQGYGSGIPLDELDALATFATGGLTPDLTILLDLPIEEGLARKRGAETRFETVFDVDYHRRVRQGFLALARAEPHRFTIVDANRDPAEVARDVLTIVGRLAVPQGTQSEPKPALPRMSR